MARIRTAPMTTTMMMMVMVMVIVMILSMLRKVQLQMGRAFMPPYKCTSCLMFGKGRVASFSGSVLNAKLGILTITP